MSGEAIESEPTCPCPCGHDRHSNLVSAEEVHTVVGWAFLLVGVSSRPVSLRYRCRRCEHVVAETSDEAVLARHY